MYKIISSLTTFALSSTLLFAANMEKANIEVTAKHVEGSGSTLYAKDGVVVYYRDSIIHADSAAYNKSEHTLVLDGHVEMIGYQGTKEQTSHMEINTQTDTIAFKELFFTNENDIWLMANDAKRVKSIYTFGESMLSSCDINDPLWKMHFSSSKYDSEAKYMKLYNTSVYFNDIPVFYTPYIAFSTDNKRSSGLLFPRLGYTEDEGFVYEQPIFWAISDNMDMEFDPQIRTDRSIGMYATYRFVDSDHSHGTLRAGYFKDKDAYLKKHNLTDSDHYGVEFLYDSSSIFSRSLPPQYSDGLYANITLLNDIEYLNLQKTHLTHFGQVPLQESRLNYFIQNDDWYGGLNAKYFIDTRLPDNDSTLQVLPALQAHKFLKSLFVDNLTYSLDVQTKNLERKTGTTLSQVEFRVPIEFTASFLDDYLNVSLGEYLYFGRFNFSGDQPLWHDYFQYYSNVHNAKIFSDLTAKFDTFTHVLQPSISYVIPGNESQDPLNFDELLTDQPQVKDLFSVGLPEEQIRFSLNQYFYDDAMKLIFFQRLSQGYYPDRDYELADLQNEMEYNWKNWSFYNNIYYSFEYDDISEASSSIRLNEKDYSIALGHTFKQVLSDDVNTVTANDISLDFRYAYNERFAVHGGLIYNLEDESSKLWRFGASYTRDCWSLAASVAADIRPRPTSVPGVTDYTEEIGFFFQLSFIPFASFNSADLDTLSTMP
jgi:LPS-assembly protein